VRFDRNAVPVGDFDVVVVEYDHVAGRWLDGQVGAMALEHFGDRRGMLPRFGYGLVNVVRR
jgi:hypothetical protein